jgi:hypothetical protein
MSLQAKRLGASLALGLVLSVFAVARAAADEFNGQFSGTAISAFFDPDHATVSSPAGYFNFGGSSNFGRFTINGEQELTPTGSCTGAAGECASSGVKLTAPPGHQGRCVYRFSSTGDLLFVFTSPDETACLDLGAKPFPTFCDTTTGKIVGGFGRFQGATGSISLSTSAAILDFDAALRPFVAVQSSFTGTIDLK